MYLADKPINAKQQEIEMVTLNYATTTTRSIFIETLSDESTLMTGYGIYAHLSPLNIDRLFNEFINQSLPVRKFAKRYLRTIGAF